MFKLSQDEFAEAVAAACRKAGVTEELTYDKDDFSLRSNGELDIVCYLGNAYDVYCSLPFWKRSNLITEHARATVEALSVHEVDTFAKARPMVRARVRSRMYHELARLDALAQGQDPYNAAIRLLDERLTIDICIDRPQSMQLVGTQQLADWNCTFDDALAIGLHNLEAVSLGALRRVKPGVYASQWADGYDSSRILISNLFDPLALKGRPVVMIPDVNTLVVTGDADDAGLTAMANYARNVPKGPKPVSTRAFRLNATWEAFMPDKTHPAYGILAEMAIQDQLGEYAAQKLALEKLYESQSVDTFVASLSAKRDKTSGEITTYVSWGNPCNTHLPKADTIVFLDMLADEKGKILGHIDWNKAVDIVGDVMLAEPDMYPPRYHVTAFPSALQLGLMGLTKFELAG